MKTGKPTSVCLSDSYEIIRPGLNLNKDCRPYDLTLGLYFFLKCQFAAVSVTEIIDKILTDFNKFYTIEYVAV